VKKDEQMAIGICKFRSMLDWMDEMGVILSENGKINVLLSDGEILLPSTKNEQNSSLQTLVDRRSLQEEYRLEAYIKAKDRAGALKVRKENKNSRN
jgi:hypothetical protein